MRTLGIAVSLLGMAMWASVPIVLAWRGQMMTRTEWVLFAALPIALLGLAVAD